MLYQILILILDEDFEFTRDVEVIKDFINK